MKRALVLLLLVVASFAGIRVPRSSVLPIQVRGDDGLSNVCTAFSINQVKGYWMTANHCFSEQALFDGKPMEWVAFSEQADLAIFQASRRPALRLSPVEPVIGDEVVLWGYPQGSLDLIAFFGRIANPKARVTADLTVMVLGLTALGGDSGGPILDKSGRVVAVAQNSNRAGLEWNIPWATLQEFAPYWEQ